MIALIGKGAATVAVLAAILLMLGQHPSARPTHHPIVHTTSYHPAPKHPVRRKH